MPDVKEKIRLFQSSARFYLSSKEMHESFQTGRISTLDRFPIGYIEENLRFVENILEQFKEKCGPAARLIVYLLYVEKHTQSYISDEFSITRRQLQYSLEKWMDAVFADDDMQTNREERFLQRSAAFKESCRMYEREKKLVETCNENDQLKKYLSEDINFVDKTFETFKEKCGETAADVFWKLYVKKNKQSAVAQEMNISRRKLQYHMEEWLHKVFDEAE